MSGAGGKIRRFLYGPNRAFLRILVRIAALVAVLTALGIVLFARSLERREQVEISPADGIVVLTGGAERIDDALLLLERGMGRRLFISGVNTRSTPELLKRRWPGQEALFACCVDLDYQARNTYENAVESRRWAQGHGFKSLILVTASYHLPRAKLEFDHAMPGMAIQAYPVVPEASRINRWWQEPVLTRIIALEFFKYWAASVRTALRFSGG